MYKYSTAYNLAQILSARIWLYPENLKNSNNSQKQKHHEVYGLQNFDIKYDNLINK